MSSSESPLVRVEHVSKKFCKSLKRSLWYGLRDLGGELLGRAGDDRLRLRQDEFLAVDDVSFELRRGECLGLIGANGAGKSTLLKMLNGLVRPDAGKIEIRGRVGALIELGAGFNPILTGRENVYVNGAVLGLTKKEIDARFDQIVEFAELGEFIDTPVQSYSSGMRVRLGFAVAAHLEPDVLLIDEVLAVGDAAFVGRCISRVAALSKNSAIVFVSHHLALIARVANRVVALERGRAAAAEAGPSAAIEALLATLPWPQRTTTGTGHLELRRFSIRSRASTDHDGELTLDSESGVIVELDIVAGRPIPRCFVNVHLHDLEACGVLECDSRRSGTLLEGLQGRISIVVTLPPLPLNAGRYTLSTHVVELRPGGLPGELLLVGRNIGRLEVRSKLHAFAPLQPAGQWVVTQSDA
ncbi:MAG: polysaccharide ABC transporter ATP-binding protein [Candidatus Binatia bacterium]